MSAKALYSSMKSCGCSRAKILRVFVFAYEYTREHTLHLVILAMLAVHAVSMTLLSMGYPIIIFAYSYCRILSSCRQCLLMFVAASLGGTTVIEVPKSLHAIFHSGRRSQTYRCQASWRGLRRLLLLRLRLQLRLRLDCDFDCGRNGDDQYEYVVSFKRQQQH